MTLLIAIPLIPRKDAEMLTAHSGALVPMATMVIPMIKTGTLNFFATEPLPSTKKSAPLTNSINPIMTPTIANIISIFLSYVKRTFAIRFPYLLMNAVALCSSAFMLFHYILHLIYSITFLLILYSISFSTIFLFFIPLLIIRKFQDVRLRSSHRSRSV